MTKEQFLELIELLKTMNDNSIKYMKFGIDLHEGENSVVEPAYRVIDLLLDSIYTVEGVDWFNWFCYENNFGEKRLAAHETDNETLICQTAEELYEYIEQYRKK